MEDSPQVSRVLRRMMRPVIFGLSGLMTVVVLAQVVFRYVLSQPLPWSEELARYLMVWIVCLASSEAYAQGSHIGVTMVIDALPPGMRKIMLLIIHLAVSVLMLIIIYQGFRLSFLVSAQLSPAMEISMTWPYLAVPVGASLTLIQVLALFVKQVGEPPPAK